MTPFSAKKNGKSLRWPSFNRISHDSFKAITKAVRLAKKAFSKQLSLSLVSQAEHTPARKKTRRKSASASDLLAIWSRLRLEYFPQAEELSLYTVRWSGRRQKRTLGTCNIKRKTVTVAHELKCAECEKWLSPLLYHEMCHAVLGESLKLEGRKTPWHGARFRELEKRHPGTRELTHWMRSGGWQKAVRASRMRQVWQKRAERK